MKYGYSATTNSFYDLERKDVFISFGTWPEDVIEISDDVSSNFMSNPQPGKRRVAGDDGLPSWGELEGPSEQDAISSAELKKSSLSSLASREIAWRQDAVDAEIATDDEIADLSAWKKYRVLLMRVDTSNPRWPEIPE